MRNCKLYSIRYVVILVVLLLAVPIAKADKKKANKKETTEYAYLEPEKPANSYKAIPDSHPQKPGQTNIAIYIVEKNHLNGIDVSHYQERIDWKTVSKDKNVGYVYLKATESNNLVDETYAFNLSEARSNGLKVGSYHFFRPTVDATSQFENFRRIVNKKKQDLLPIIDVEVTGGVTTVTMHARLLELLKLVTKEYGQHPLIYTGKSFYNKYFAGSSQYKQYMFMIAQYTTDEPSLSDGNDFIMWQFTAKGSVNGIRGNVDRSCFVGRHSIKEILYR